MDPHPIQYSCHATIQTHQKNYSQIGIKRRSISFRVLKETQLFIGQPNCRLSDYLFFLFLLLLSYGRPGPLGLDRLLPPNGRPIRYAASSKYLNIQRRRSSPVFSLFFLLAKVGSSCCFCSRSLPVGGCAGA